MGEVHAEHAGDGGQRQEQRGDDVQAVARLQRLAAQLGLFLAVALTRGGLDQEKLLSHIITDGVIYLALVAAAFLAFRALRRSRDSYILTDGLYRLRAAETLGLEKIPAVVE